VKNLRDALKARFEEGDANALDKAIRLYRDALQIRPPGHPLRRDLLSCLATPLHTGTRGAQPGNADILVEAIELHREALGLHSTGDSDCVDSMYNLAKALTIRFEQQGDLDALRGRGQPWYSGPPLSLLRVVMRIVKLDANAGV
jgi:hypothetical protein